jgi:hypothetical protein
VITAFVEAILAIVLLYCQAAVSNPCNIAMFWVDQASYRIASRTPPSRNWVVAKLYVVFRAKFHDIKGYFRIGFAITLRSLSKVFLVKSMLMSADLPVSSRSLIRRFCFQYYKLSHIWV